VASRPSPRSVFGSETSITARSRRRTPTRASSKRFGNGPERSRHAAVHPLQGVEVEDEGQAGSRAARVSELGIDVYRRAESVADEVVEAVRAQEKDDEQERACRSSSLVQSHGKQAVIAMAARGVGPHNAARIINKLRENEDDFYRNILAQEREYVRTQSFWD